MIESHPSFPPPADLDVKLWRYVDLSKFLHLVQNRQLHFCRADRLGDPFEGSSTRPTRDAIFQQLSADPDVTEDVVNEYMSRLAMITQLGRQENYISCWHAADHESAAMWSLYSQSFESVALQTTFSKLAEQLPY